MATLETQQDLAYIKNIMQEGRKIIVDNGVGFIVWGILIATGMIFNYFALVYRIPGNILLIWGILFGIGILVTVWGAVKDRKRKQAETLAGKFLGAIWVGVIITLSMNGFLGNLHPALAASILGLGYFPTGYVTGFSMFRYLAFAWWAGAAVMFVYPGLYTALVFALMMIVLQVIPGIVVYIRCKHEVSKTVATESRV